MQINEGRIYFGRSISHHNMDDGFNYFYIVEIILLDWQQCRSCFWFSLTDDVKKLSDWLRVKPTLMCWHVPSNSNFVKKIAIKCFLYSVSTFSITVGVNGAGTVEFLSVLARHQRAVNTVRFSPNGEILASREMVVISLCYI